MINLNISDLESLGIEQTVFHNWETDSKLLRNHELMITIKSSPHFINYKVKVKFNQKIKQYELFTNQIPT